MNKIEFIEFCLNNGYQYSETKKEISIDKVIDDIGNITLGIVYDKSDKTFGISSDRDVNSKDAPNSYYVLNDIELKILGYLIELLEKENTDVK